MKPQPKKQIPASPPMKAANTAFKKHPYEAKNKQSCSKNMEQLFLMA
jgi:hypothetical protein